MKEIKQSIIPELVSVSRLFSNGFTLIELLVVVLIIAILAAVALPQYQKAVIRARLAEYESNLSTLARVADVCAAAKGEPCIMQELDIAMPTCTPLPGYFEFCVYTIGNDRISIMDGDGHSVFSFFPHRRKLAHGLEEGVSTAMMQGIYCNTGLLSIEQCKKLGFSEFVIYNHYKRP